MELPENLFGEKWAFVQLPFSAVQKEISSLDSNMVFGASLDLDLLGIEIDDETLIPGLAVASSRAKPLAAWMNGLEVCSIEVDFAQACLILSIGIYATYKKSEMTTKEAEAWEEAKKAHGGLHFLAIQGDLESNDCWILASTRLAASTCIILPLQQLLLHFSPSLHCFFCLWKSKMNA